MSEDSNPSASPVGSDTRRLTITPALAEAISRVLDDAMGTYPGSRETPDYAVEVAAWVCGGIRSTAGESQGLPDADLTDDEFLLRHDLSVVQMTRLDWAQAMDAEGIQNPEHRYGSYDAGWAYAYPDSQYNTGYAYSESFETKEEAVGAARARFTPQKVAPTVSREPLVRRIVTAEAAMRAERVKHRISVNEYKDDAVWRIEGRLAELGVTGVDSDKTDTGRRDVRFSLPGVAEGFIVGVFSPGKQGDVPKIAVYHSEHHTKAKESWLSVKHDLSDLDVRIAEHCGVKISSNHDEFSAESDKPSDRVSTNGINP